MNAWLESVGEGPISIRTLPNDRKAITKQWHRDFDKSSEINQAQHIAALNRIKASTWESCRKATLLGGGGSSTPTWPRGRTA